MDEPEELEDIEEIEQINESPSNDFAKSESSSGHEGNEQLPCPEGFPRKVWAEYGVGNQRAYLRAIGKLPKGDK